ncbi:MAG: pyridoxamine 5'-phosphate oxidase family protein [Chloroflexi bacterium]|nr:pyridoxamine 5'-phosphate oxidase family protein [Chloroflexota bacterium]
MGKRPIESREEMEQVLREAPIGRLGTTIGDQPYVVPLAFVYESGKIYFHSKPDGQKLEAIQKNPKVCFEVDQYAGVMTDPKPCSFDMRYRSIVAYGRASLVTEPEEKMRVLQTIIDKYAGGGEVETLTQKMADTVTVVEIAVEEMTGKHNGMETSGA